MSRAITDLEPETQIRAYKLIDAAAVSGFPIMLTQTYRTKEEQDALYAQGRTTPGKIVTHAKGGQSWHEARRAFDVAFVGMNGKPDWFGPWSDLGKLGEGIGLEWGGRWPKGKQDRPHFQYTADMTLAQALAAMTQDAAAKV